MPKRSLIEQVNEVVDVVVRGKKAPARPEPGVAPYSQLAGAMRELPREDFKARLKSDLERKASSMATTTEFIAAVRTTASPRLTFKDPVKAIEFYKNAFGARETMRFETPGGIPHAEIVIGESTILLSDEWPEGGRYSAETLGNSPVMMRLSVPDVDAFTAHAISAGAEVQRPITDQFYGYREGILLDPFGYQWSVFTMTEAMSVEEMHRRFDAMMKQAEKKKPAVDPIPKGYRTITPYMVAADGPALLEFAKQAFGAEETFRTVGGAGGLHSEARLGDSMLMIGGGIPGREFKSTPNTTALHIYVEDADAAYEKALSAGATSVYAPQDHDYGERSGSVKDPAGNFWYIATHKGPSYVPKGLNSVNVYMHPLRAEPVISFIKRAFGAKELSKYASPDGVVHHAEFQVGSSVLEMGEAHGDYQPMKSMFYLYVPDCDAVYRQALQAGAASLSEPKDQTYGDRSAGVTDPFGNQWYIATHIKDM
jgi:PhnB protein